MKLAPGRAPAPRQTGASGFGDVTVAASGPTRPQHAAQAEATAAQILEKPRPAYTEEARRMKIMAM